MSKYLELLPAVDVADGKAVRLTQGEAGSETDYGSPLEAAQTWINAGAEWIHLVDLDAAFGRGDNRAIIREVVDSAKTELGLGVKIELSGGIRDDASLEAALEAGASRVNLGTAALENPEWTEKVIAKFGDAIAVGLDVRGTTLAARGWTREGGDLWEVLARLEDVRRRLAGGDRAPSDGRYFEVLDPDTDQAFALAARGSVDDVDAAVAHLLHEVEV